MLGCLDVLSPRGYVSVGDEITHMRRTQIRALEKLAAPCQRISRQWKSHFSRVPDGVRELRASFNVAFLAVLMEAMDWLKHGPCRCSGSTKGGKRTNPFDGTDQQA